MKTMNTELAAYRSKNFKWRVEGKVGVTTIDRPEKRIR